MKTFDDDAVDRLMSLFPTLDRHDIEYWASVVEDDLITHGTFARDDRMREETGLTPEAIDAFARATAMELRE